MTTTSSIPSPHVFCGNTLFIDSKCSLCNEVASHVAHIRNGGQICDTLDGPCACGAWH